MRPRVLPLLAALALTAMASATPPHLPRARPGVVVRGVSDREGVVAITVRNTGASPVVLSTELRLEHQHRGRWQVSDRAPAALQLITNCNSTPTECRTLAPGETLRLVPWSGYNALIQCSQETPSDFRAPEGHYRVVATDCAGRRTYPGAAFARTHLRPL